MGTQLLCHWEENVENGFLENLLQESNQNRHATASP